MPIRQGYEMFRGERMGYYQFGENGKKYHYAIGDERSRRRARRKAEEQRDAIYASGYRG